MSTVDTTFGVNGLASLNLPGNQRFLHSCTDASNNTLATGFIDISGDNTNWNTLIARFKPTGVLDTTFNGTGYVEVNIPMIRPAGWGGTLSNPNDYGMTIAVDNSGNILVFGFQSYGYGQVFVLRYLPNGTPDTSFANFSRIELQPTAGRWYLLGGNGILSSHYDYGNDYGNGEGQLQFMGYRDNFFYAHQKNQAASNDYWFRNNATSFSMLSHPVFFVTKNNGFYICLVSYGSYIYKFLSNGQLDPSYIDNNNLTNSYVTSLGLTKVPGILMLPFNGTDHTHSLTCDLSENVLIAGNLNNETGVLTRITPNGIIDQTFGSYPGRGMPTYMVTGFNFYNGGNNINGSIIAVDNLNRYYLATTVNKQYGDLRSYIKIERVLNNGTGDNSFASYGGGQSIYINIGVGTNDEVVCLKFDSANNIYVIGNTTAKYTDQPILFGQNLNYRFNTLNTNYTTTQIENMISARDDRFAARKIFVACFTPDGTLNKSFGNKGVALFNNSSTDTSFNYVSNFASMDSSGNIIVSGFNDINSTPNIPNDDSILIRFNPATVPVISKTCFPAGTPIVTDQGIIAIDDIDEAKHTIRGKKIVAVTSVVSDEHHLISIEKDALGKNIPSQKTLVTQNHRILHKGSMVKAKKLVDLVDNGLIKKTDYSGEILYNILLEEQGKMVVNNMITETLDPENGIAKLYKKFKLSNLTESEKNQVILELNKELASKAKTNKK